MADSPESLSARHCRIDEANLIASDETRNQLGTWENAMISFLPDDYIPPPPRHGLRYAVAGAVLVLGAIEAWKRPELALEAVALAARELPASGTAR
jgi:hypothetical protein